jgi:Cohesin domain
MSNFNATRNGCLARCKRSNVRRIIAIVMTSLALVAGLIVASARLPLASAQGGTRVRCQPAAISSSNDTVDVDLYIQNVADLYGADLRLSFDPAKAQVVDAEPGASGVQILSLNSFLSSDWPVKKDADNAAGTIWYALTQLRPTPPASGSGSVARVTFRRAAYGTFPLHFVTYELAQRDGILIPATAQDCAITFKPPSVLHHIVLAPKTATVTAGQTQAYTVQGFDAAGNSLGDLTALASFAIAGGAGGSWAGSMYTSEKAGMWTVTASVSGISDTATLTVKPAGPYTLSLVAYPTSLPVGSTSVLKATVRDRFGNLVSNGTVVTFVTDLGNVLSPRTTTDGVATSALMSTAAGTAHVTAQSGPAQGAAMVIFTPIAPTCVTIQRGALGQVIDAFIWSSQPRESFNSSKLYTGRYGCGERRTLVRFGLEMLPKGAVIKSATLGLKLNQTGSKQKVRVYRITRAWSEGWPTWRNSAGNYDGRVVWGSFVPQGTGFVTTDVTGLVSHWYIGSLPNYGLMLTSSPSYTYDEYNSSETSQMSSRPWLKVCYIVP